MDFFHYRDGQLFAEDIPLSRLAEDYGTPCFVYSRATLERHYQAFDAALSPLDHRVCYAVKANSNLAILDVLARLGASFDIVSGGELARLKHLGIGGERIVFSGVGKTAREIELALDYGVASINIESAAELERVNAIAVARQCVAPIALRINPDVDAKTHPYIATGLKDNKFGIAMDIARETFRHAAALPGLEVVGLDCHIGSQLTDLAPYKAALERLLLLLDDLAEQGIRPRHLNLGGGLGIRYKDEQPPLPSAYGEVLRATLGERDLTVFIEPGRAIAGNAGVLVTRVEYLKPTPHKNFAVVDAAMTELIRPALYQGWHEIISVQPRRGETQQWDIVGPVCESGDWLGRDRALDLQAGDLLAIRAAGAYAAVMSSHYNSRPRVAEVLVDGSQAYLARKREPVEALWALEQGLPA